MLCNLSDEEGVLSGVGLTCSKYFVTVAKQGKHVIALPKDYFEVHFEQGKILEHHKIFFECKSRNHNRHQKKIKQLKPFGI
ncbi:hypothetical protein EP18_02365 [Lysinibacillus sphaericus]|nr:hypothetical protein [Lysinibacillus sphaericus]KEK13237.1 hypothetical protein EP18_02365 [Lysinibacillus sphaericus]